MNFCVFILLSFLSTILTAIETEGSIPEKVQTDAVVASSVNESSKPITTIPIVIKQIRYKKLPVGSNVKFICSGLYTGLQPTTYKWVRNIKSKWPTENVIDDGRGNLSISSLQKRDSGVYICVVKDGLGYTYSKVKILVQEKNVSSIQGNTTEVVIPAWIVPSRVIEAGSTVKLICALDGINKETAKLEWVKFLELLPKDGMVDDGKGNLTIFNIRPSDSGDYYCSDTSKSESELASDSSAWINVLPKNDNYDTGIITTTNAQKIEITTAEDDDFTEITSYVGDALKLKCRTAGDSILHKRRVFTWSKSDGILPQGKVIQNYLGDLVVSNLNKNDAGVYKCSSYDGISIHQASVLLYILQKNDSTKLLPTPLNYISESTKKDITLYVGETLRLTASGGLKENAGIYKWHKDGVKDLVGERIIHDSQGTLIISNVTVNDSGRYTYQKEKQRTRTSYTSTWVKLTVLPKNDSEMDSELLGDLSSVIFVNPMELKYRVGRMNESIELICNSEKIDKFEKERAVFIWSKDGGELPNGRSYDDHKGRLIISNLKPDDTGSYTCSINTDSLFEKTSIFINVPYTIGHNSEINVSSSSDQNSSLVAARLIYKIVQVGDKLVLSCAKNHSLPQESYFTWFKNGLRPSNGKVDNQGNFAFTIISNNDTGIYTCISKDGSIYDSIEIFVPYIDDNLTSKTTELSFQINESNLFAKTINAGETVKLKCVGKSLDPQKAVYVWHNSNKKLPYRRAIHDIHGNLVISNIKPRDTGVFTCKGTDGSGFSIAEVSITVLHENLTIPQVVPFENVKWLTRGKDQVIDTNKYPVIDERNYLYDGNYTIAYDKPDLPHDICLSKMNPDEHNFYLEEYMYGVCRHLQHCPLSDVTKSVDDYVLHFCGIEKFDEWYAGICCPF